MEQVKYTVMRYASPEVKVVFIKTQSIICISDPEKYTTEMEEGDDNW